MYLFSPSTDADRGNLLTVISSRRVIKTALCTHVCNAKRVVVVSQTFTDQQNFTMGSNTEDQDTTRPFALKAGDWDHYVKYRPAYPESMWKSWLAYHDGALDSLLDVGTGGGVGAASLLAVANTQGQQVKRLYLSDPGENNLLAAKKNFDDASSSAGGMQVHYHRGPAEEAFPGLADGSVDMIIACASIHWTDIEVAISTAADALRPGGTFAAVVYPQPTIRGDDEAAEALAAVFEQRRRFQDDTSDKIGDDGQGPSSMRAIRARAYRNLSIGLDYVPFDPEKWDNVHRRTANLPPDGKWPLRDLTWARYGEPKQAVLEGTERVEIVEVDDWWTRKEYTVDQLKEFFQTLGYEPFVMDGRLWETDVFKTFERIVKSKAGTFELVWPVATVLARRR